jgi:hypothetical protein
MKNIALIDVDGHNFPNLALMKISAHHKKIGNKVDWFDPLFSCPDSVYASKVFTFTPDYQFYPADCDVIKGGTGYDVATKLPEEVESEIPDYSIYPDCDYGVGFLTRGCIRSCPWCVVPRKEGDIRVVDDIERIAVRKKMRLLDNNFLASPEDFIHEQCDKISKMKIRIDFNQALDARLVNGKNAVWLAKCKWDRYIRFSCDTDSCIEPVATAIKLLRASGYTGEFFVYVLAKDVDNALKRIEAVEKMTNRVTPFCMPYRDFSANAEPSDELKHLARWCNRPEIRKTVRFTEYNQ